MRKRSCLARALLGRRPTEWGKDADRFRKAAAGLRDLCVRLTEVRCRPLFHARSRRIWDLREEVDLLDRYVMLKMDDPGGVVRSDVHLPGTYRGGMVARLQRVLAQRPDGTYVAPADWGASAEPDPERLSDPGHEGPPQRTEIQG